LRRPPRVTSLAREMMLADAAAYATSSPTVARTRRGETLQAVEDLAANVGYAGSMLSFSG
jgi:hypothetical protein